MRSNLIRFLALPNKARNFATCYVQSKPINNPERRLGRQGDSMLNTNFLSKPRTFSGCCEIDTSKLLPTSFVAANGETLEIDIGKMEDLEDCAAFGREMFRTKPLRLFLTEEVLERMDFVTPWTAACLKSKISLVARNSTGTVIAVRMSQLSTAENPARTPEEVLAVAHVISKLNEGIDIFDTFKIKRFVHFAYLAVDPNYRRQGLIEKMFAISTEIAKMNGAEAIVVDGINKRATKAAIRSGFEIVNTMNVSAIKDKIPTQKFAELMAENPEVSLLIRSLS